MLPSCR